MNVFIDKHLFVIMIMFSREINSFLWIQFRSAFHLNNPIDFLILLIELDIFYIDDTLTTA